MRCEEGEKNFSSVGSFGFDVGSDECVPWKKKGATEFFLMYRGNL